MLKKIKTFVLSILMLLGLTSCIPKYTIYSFENITNQRISDIDKVKVNYGPMMSVTVDLVNYKKILDIEYRLSDLSYNDTLKIKEDYRFHIWIEFNSKYINNIDFYVYQNKLYYFSETYLYESFKTVNSGDFYLSSTLEEVLTLNLFVMYDYGIHTSDKITTLLDGNLIWFDLDKYKIDNLIAGDELIIKYSGEYVVYETYPGVVDTKKIHIQSIEVNEAEIAEFIVTATPGSGEIDLVPVEAKYNNFILLNDEGNVVSKDGSFKKYSELPVGTKVYGSLPKTTNSIRVDGLYDYYPRMNDVVPTGQFELKIIDKLDNIINKPSTNQSWYTPGTSLEFYAYPIMDADLAMYVNNEFYQIQTCEKNGDDFIWKYSFEMPMYDVVLEFKVESIDYLNVSTILNIPLTSLDEIIEVRYEQGYIGVAPGSLTNIQYSTDYEDRNNVFRILQMPVYEEKSNNWQVCGGGYNFYTLITNDKKYDIYISNGYLFANQKHYKFIGEYIPFEYPSLKAHSFITYNDTFDAFTIDNVKIGEFNGLSKYEFIEYPYDELTENVDIGYIETEIGRLYVHSENIFYIKEDNQYSYYLIVGENNFSFFYS